MTAFLILAAATAAWVVSLIVHPFGRCWRCLGKGNLRRKGRRRAPKCWACRGYGRRQRAGSRTVHRIRRTVTAGWQHRKEDVS